ncbi:hypothetical protein [Pelagicoccus sp. SDUM812003]|uniref:hypothetical protein n=1 Tax=Pelagicoccus sp. SDUM812003 TaxID=3041267 RepID=UPI0028107333|nr:hypothetical protein [Pelagicoccus sp. SDUM812003]MDQ8204028.1 hypothetical protein [Pelagicoccus sp. SDUM812003]
MKRIQTLFFAGLASLTFAAGASGDSLLGQRYVGLSIGSDFDFDEASYGIEFNSNLHRGLDLGLDLASSDDGDRIMATLDLTFYRDLTGGQRSFAYFSPIAGYVDLDYPSLFEDSNSFLYGAKVGIEHQLTDRTNLDLSTAYIDTDELGDLGVTFGVEINRWLTDSINAGVEISYNSEAEDEAISLFGRWRF